MRWLFDTIVSGVVSIGKALLAFGRACVHYYKIMAAAMVATAVFIKEIVMWIADKVVEIFERVEELNGMVAEADGLSNQGLLDAGIGAYINAFFPLEECIAMTFLLATTYVLAAIIRAIKGWVPTLG